jgi:DNA-directed RNA polymerase subunit M/transcription elongation factor TFIIS
MNKCKRCGSILIAHENIHVVDGELYCSRNCAVRNLAERFLQDDNTAKRYNDAFNVAKEYYEDCVDIVDPESILAEDMQDVQIAVTYFKTVKVPKCLSKKRAEEVVEMMWNKGIISAEPDDCDDVQFECELVSEDNSSCEEAAPHD